VGSNPTPSANESCTSYIIPEEAKARRTAAYYSLLKSIGEPLSVEYGDVFHRISPLRNWTVNLR
jgi:hypothetical protein